MAGLLESPYTLGGLHAGTQVLKFSFVYRSAGFLPLQAQGHGGLLSVD